MMSKVLELIVDLSLPLATRWVIIQIAYWFGKDLNNNTGLWFVTLIICSIVAEFFTFRSKRKCGADSE